MISKTDKLPTIDIFEAIQARRSNRQFKKQPVPRAIITTLIDLARLAPSSCNLQLTEYIIVDNEETRRRLAKEVTGKFNWGCSFIIFIYDKRFTVGRNAAVTSLGAAMQNILLGCQKFGLAACPMAGFKKDIKLRAILAIPETYEIALIMAIGYSESTLHKERLLLDPHKVIHDNKWANKENILNDSLDLDLWTRADLINYRSRMAPVYLYGNWFHLNSLDERVYQQILEEGTLKQLTREAKQILDVLTYDGTFARGLLKSGYKGGLTVSDLFSYPVEVFKRNYPNTKTRIVFSASDPKYDLVTLIHKIEFTSQYEEAFTWASKQVKPGGHLYLTTTDGSSLKRVLRLVDLLFKRLRGEVVNVYEQNPFYKIGPYKPRGLLKLQHMAEAFKLQECAAGRNTVLGHQYEWIVFKKS